MAKKNNKKEKTVYAWLGFGGAVLVCIGIAIIVIISNIKPKTIKLTSDQEIAYSAVRVAVAISKARGGGSISNDECESFRELAKAYNKDTDWFNGGYCNYYVYADYNDTENKTTITFSDGTHAAYYEFDSDGEYLLNYEFVVSEKKGRFISIDD